MKADPCNCTTRCPHGDRCLGGHANSPNRHWYMCDKCTVWSRTLTLEEARKELEDRRRKPRKKWR